MKYKIMRNVVTMEKCLNLNDHFQKLFEQKKIFSQRMLDDTMKDESLTLNYYMMLMGYGPSAFTQFTDTNQKKKYYCGFAFEDYPRNSMTI